MFFDVLSLLYVFDFYFDGLIWNGPLKSKYILVKTNRNVWQSILTESLVQIFFSYYSRLYKVNVKCGKCGVNIRLSLTVVVLLL